MPRSKSKKQPANQNNTWWPVAFV